MCGYTCYVYRYIDKCVPHKRAPTTAADDAATTAVPETLMDNRGNSRPATCQRGEGRHIDSRKQATIPSHFSTAHRGPHPTAHPTARPYSYYRISRPRLHGLHVIQVIWYTNM